MSENSRVKDERHEVKNEGYEQRAVDGLVVSLPHKLNKNADLAAWKDLVVCCLGEDLDQSCSVVLGKDPVEIEQLSFYLLNTVVVLDCTRNVLDLLDVVLDKAVYRRYFLAGRIDLLSFIFWLIVAWHAKSFINQILERLVRKIRGRNVKEKLFISALPL